MPTLKKFFCLLREFWKPISRASSKNLKYFQGKYLWSVTVVKPLSLRFTCSMSLLNSVDGVGSVGSWHRGCRGSSFGMGRVGRVGQENFGAGQKKK